MPYRIPWMTGVDRLLLDWFEEKDVVAKPSVVAVNLERELSEEEMPSAGQIRRRMKYLEEEAGLLEQYGDARGQYMISEKGWRYFNEEMSEDERLELATLDPQQGGDS